MSSLLFEMWYLSDFLEFIRCCSWITRWSMKSLLEMKFEIRSKQTRDPLRATLKSRNEYIYTSTSHVVEVAPEQFKKTKSRSNCSTIAGCTSIVTPAKFFCNIMSSLQGTCLVSTYQARAFASLLPCQVSIRSNRCAQALICSQSVIIGLWKTISSFGCSMHSTSSNP